MRKSRGESGDSTDGKAVGEDCLEDKDCGFEYVGPLEEFCKIGDGTAGVRPLVDKTLEYSLEVDGQVLGSKR